MKNNHSNIKNKSDQGHRNQIGPVYLGDLNHLFIDSANFTVVEDLYDDNNGACVIIRSTEPCEMSVPEKIYNNYMIELK